MKTVEREILLGFWKVHILHHAEAGPVYGHWISEELRRHGYTLSPGTLYPLLSRMEKHGWLRVQPKQNAGPRERRDYRLTAEGRKVLTLVRAQVQELYREVVAEADPMVSAGAGQHTPDDTPPLQTGIRVTDRHSDSD